MTAIYQWLAIQAIPVMDCIQARFADAAACLEPLGGVPDLVCIQWPAGNVLLVGEIKTWWKHNLKTIWGMESGLRRALASGRIFEFYLTL
jgi:hypothetical protein